MTHMIGAIQYLKIMVLIYYGINEFDLQLDDMY